MNVEIVADLTREYLEAKGDITCEFATTPDHLPEVVKQIREYNKALLYLGAHWVMLTCDRCQQFHGDDYFIHCEIVKSR